MTTKQLITVRWPNGTADSGHTYDDILDKVRTSQQRGYSRRAMITELHRRAKVWTGRDLPPQHTARGIIKALAKAGIVTITRG